MFINESSEFNAALVFCSFCVSFSFACLGKNLQKFILHSVITFRQCGYHKSTVIVYTFINKPGALGFFFFFACEVFDDIYFLKT